MTGRATSQTQRQGIGLVRSALAGIGLVRQSDRFRRHGSHVPAPDAPLVLVACSGGRDSLALAALTATVAGELGLRAGAVLVDHGLQAGSDAVAARAADQCRRLGLDPVCVRKVRIDPHHPDGTEAAARSARYTALCDEARRLGAGAVLLAHTQDDQAETLLLRLLAGSSPSALAGMPAVFERGSVRFLRPILTLSRAQTTRICRERGLAWWDDPTNGEGIGTDDPRFDTLPLRSRVRGALLPLARRLAGEAVDAHLADVAASQRQDQQALRRLADEAFTRLRRQGGQTAPDSEHTGCRAILLDTAGLRALPTALRTRVLVTALVTLLQGGAEDNADDGEDVLRRAGIGRVVIEGLDRYVLGRMPVPSYRISSGLSASRQGAVTVLCQNGSHADR
jgi:tRNA(Ile)-lysidine synthase